MADQITIPKTSADERAEVATEASVKALRDAADEAAKCSGWKTVERFLNARADALEKADEARNRPDDFVLMSQPCPACITDPTEHDDPMWSETFGEVQRDVTYKPGYRLLLKPDAEVPAGRWYYQVECDRIDAITGKPGTGRGGKAYLSPHATRSELVQTAFGLFKGFEEHEAREFFRWSGHQVFGPHMDVLGLAETAERTETRQAGVER